MARSWWARRQLDQSRTCCRLCFPCHSRRVSRWRTSGTLRCTPPGRVFFSSAAQHRQHGVGQHGQGDVTLPSLPVANLVVVQPTLSLGRLEALFDLPALSSHAHQESKGGFGSGGVAQIEGVFELLSATAPHRSEEHTSELQSLRHLVCRLLLEK